jgi:hypothetical protein
MTIAPDDNADAGGVAAPVRRRWAELRAKDPNYRGLDWWIEQVTPERKGAREEPAA